ncbi:Dihydrodipicolinate synthase/N-acetylneuraminate lyase [Chitinophaga ginsengisegetis]|uniref:Dihydrodipicolinate synthase/N-acetylneuraminate lyase n=1 Tax=Chitinophaga ginsengisegetis TaxID=393003 RepID=A0A1T5PBB6_9BACT|nr:dihydrodipicolinate synthase family protein [Chitinophaga ginsengisegetis]SKD10034.1 Dihydrodipicolinate synthase/N-acetylneuraminate lyase [Chitinophaga ginsengisegetis]
MAAKILSPAVKTLLHQGTFIPAHPLALTSELRIDEKRQRALTRYYLESGSGGIAIGVHTTQFEIRDPKFNLLERVLELTADEIQRSAGGKTLVKVAGICGSTSQAVKEAELAVKYGYDIGLLSLGGLNDWTDEALIKHVRTIADILPVFGFYLQPAVGGRILSYEFWKAFAGIPNVEAIKVAAFNRYQTLDVVRAVCDSTRMQEVALYTGNDDNLVADLLTPFRFVVNGATVEKRFVGGLLGHWSVWTKPAVELFNKIKHSIANNNEGIADLLATGVMITDMNAAIFDPSNQFHGCISGIHEVLRREQLLEGIWCLNPHESLSPGQSSEIDRVLQAYPSLTKHSR